jgi:hypothetical protein
MQQRRQDTASRHRRQRQSPTGVWLTGGPGRADGTGRIAARHPVLRLPARQIAISDARHHLIPQSITESGKPDPVVQEQGMASGAASRANRSRADHSRPGRARARQSCVVARPAGSPQKRQKKQEKPIVKGDGSTLEPIVAVDPGAAEPGAPDPGLAEIAANKMAFGRVVRQREAGSARGSAVSSLYWIEKSSPARFRACPHGWAGRATRISSMHKAGPGDPGSHRGV